MSIEAGLAREEQTSQAPRQTCVPHTGKGPHAYIVCQLASSQSTHSALSRPHRRTPRALRVLALHLHTARTEERGRRLNSPLQVCPCHGTNPSEQRSLPCWSYSAAELERWLPWTTSGSVSRPAMLLAPLHTFQAAADLHGLIERQEWESLCWCSTSKLSWSPGNHSARCNVAAGVGGPPGKAAFTARRSSTLSHLGLAQGQTWREAAPLAVRRWWGHS